MEGNLEKQRNGINREEGIQKRGDAIGEGDQKIGSRRRKGRLENGQQETGGKSRRWRGVREWELGKGGKLEEVGMERISKARTGK